MRKRSEHPKQAELGEVQSGHLASVFGNRRRGYAAFVVITITLLIVVAVPCASYFHNNAKQRAAASAARSDYTAHEQECMRFVFPEARLECLIDKANASYQQRHAQQDLRAQQDMAGATIVLMATGIVGLLASVVGIILVYENLREMRRQTLATREIGENQTKAYAWVREASVSFPNSEEPERGLLSMPAKQNIGVRLIVRNEGETPATDVTAWATLQVYSTSGNALAPITLEYEADASKNPKMRVAVKGSEEPLWLFIPDDRPARAEVDTKPSALGNALSENYWQAIYGAHRFEVVGVLQYRDVFRHWHHSSFKFFGTVKDDGKIDKAFRSEDSEILFQKIKQPRLSE